MKLKIYYHPPMFGFDSDELFACFWLVYDIDPILHSRCSKDQANDLFQVGLSPFRTQETYILILFSNFHFAIKKSLLRLLRDLQMRGNNFELFPISFDLLHLGILSDRQSHQFRNQRKFPRVSHPFFRPILPHRLPLKLGAATAAVHARASKYIQSQCPRNKDYLLLLEIRKNCIIKTHTF